jgi:small subunit ribosomal protein S20
MPIKKAAKEALRHSKRRHTINLKVREELKNIIKKFRELIAEKKTDEAKKLINTCYKLLDRAVKKKVIKKNAASRKKSRLAQALKKLTQPKK